MRRRVVAAVAATAMLGAACSGGGSEEEAERPSTTSTSAAPTATTLAAHTGAPLTGLPADQAALARPALVIKFDNAPKGRPQEGVGQADVVVEEQVEGGITRLAAIFHSTLPPQVGPVRSARSTDIALLAPLHRPLFAYAGTNAAFQAQIDDAPLVPLTPGAARAAYYRVGGRPAPYNLWARTEALYAAAPTGSEPPPPMFQYRPDGQAPGGSPADGISLEFRGRVLTAVRWEWDASTGVYVRTQNGTPHVSADGSRITAPNVVVQFVDYVDTGFVDQSGAGVPEADLIGEGDVLVLTGGHVIRGRWHKRSAGEVTSYVDGGGNPILLARGTTWLELPKPGMASLG